MNRFTEKQLRVALKTVKADSRFDLKRWHKDRCGDAYTEFFDNSKSGLFFDFEQYCSIRGKIHIRDRVTGWGLVVVINGYTQKVYFNNQDQNATYPEIAELIEQFMDIL